MMARRSGGTHKGVEEKRRSLPIYQHYTLSPGKTKSHHPEAKCNHCLKEFVCGSKQRLIRHLRKCNSVQDPDHIIAETLNSLARNSATGQLNHSILEASNLLPSQIPHTHHNQIVNQPVHHSPSTTIHVANNSNNLNNNVNNIPGSHNTSGSSNDTAATYIATSSNGGLQITTAIPVKPRPQRRGRKPANQSLASSSGIQVTTGADGKTHFTPASQLPTNISGAVNTPIISQVHNGRPVGYTYTSTTVSSASPAPGAHLAVANAVNSGHLACATSNHHPTTYKLNSDPIDKAYLKLVLTRNLPLSLCDTKEFQLWVKTFANDYKPPSSINLITQNFKNEAQAAKQRISNILAKAPKKTINLELYNWQDESRGHLWYAIVANIDYKRFLISVRDINSINQQHQNSNSSINHTTDGTPRVAALSEFIDDCIKRVGSDRINSLSFSGPNVGNSLESLARKSLITTHPSIVTYHCWWHFTNILCADIVENDEIFLNVMRNSNRLIDLVSKRPRLANSLERFSPFAGIAGSMYQKKNDRRWYSHLVCYLLEYIKNNNEAIIKALEATTIQSQLSSDNNNNSAPPGNSQPGIQQTNNLSTQQQHQHIVLCQEDAQLIEIKSIIMSNDYWEKLNLLQVYLKPIQELIALTSTIFTHQSNHATSNPTDLPVQQPTPAISPTFAANLSLSDYMFWFLKYGKTLFDSWRQNPDSLKYQLIGSFLSRFQSSISEFKLLFASYLLNPKHRCAYMTQRAKNTAIEEILNIASEFMPEESDGHTIFDQWKLYLVREEPYDVVYEENRSTPLDWWMSLPCAESIRRVALRILRLKALTSPKQETLFSQLYFYEDEAKTAIDNSTFEDIAVLRYFYDYEDKIGQNISHNSSHNLTSTANNAPNALSSNGYHDRAQVGQVHNQQLNNNSGYAPFGFAEIVPGTNGQVDESSSVTEGRQSFSDPFLDVTVESYLNNHHNSHPSVQAQTNLGVASNLAIENLQGYELFTQFIDYNDQGVQIVEEPIEKKKRKWTAQEILSKCQSNNHQNNNNNNNINSK